MRMKMIHWLNQSRKTNWQCLCKCFTHIYWSISVLIPKLDTYHRRYTFATDRRKFRNTIIDQSTPASNNKQRFNHGGGRPKSQKSAWTLQNSFVKVNNDCPPPIITDTWTRYLVSYVWFEWLIYLYFAMYLSYSHFSCHNRRTLISASQVINPWHVEFFKPTQIFVRILFE